MQAQSPPAKIARFADHTEMGLTGTGGGDSQSQSQSQPVGLDLGLGPGLTTPHGRCRFTLLQMQELEHQALIFKYMAAGIPVPSHLVLPIWKSVVSSHSGAGIYPSFLGCRGVCFDYRNSMEPEPGRCRRTDGKKWRCSKDVIPDQKYCERHMHRGRGNRRSRKPVETTTITTPSSQISGSTTSRHNNVTASNTNIPVAVPLQLMTPTTDNNNTITAANNSSYSNVYPTLGFSPKSVLQTKAESCL